MKQKVFNWKAGHTSSHDWDRTDELNKELDDGWKIVGCMKPSTVLDPGSPTGGNAVYRSVLIILEKSDGS